MFVKPVKCIKIEICSCLLVCVWSYSWFFRLRTSPVWLRVLTARLRTTLRRRDTSWGDASTVCPPLQGRSLPSRETRVRWSAHSFKSLHPPVRNRWSSPCVCWQVTSGWWSSIWNPRRRGRSLPAWILSSTTAVSISRKSHTGKREGSFLSSNSLSRFFVQTKTSLFLWDHAVCVCGCVCVYCFWVREGCYFCVVLADFCWDQGWDQTFNVISLTTHEHPWLQPSSFTAHELYSRSSYITRSLLLPLLCWNTSFLCSRINDK